MLRDTSATRTRRLTCAGAVTVMRLTTRLASPASPATVAAIASACWAVSTAPSTMIEPGPELTVTLVSGKREASIRRNCDRSCSTLTSRWSSAAP